MEGALVFASIIVGLAVADQLVSLHRLLRPRHQVRWDWAAPIVALLVLLTQVQTWWSLAQQRGTMTIGGFLPVLVLLILLFLLASATLPDEVPEDGIDLRTYYQDNCPYIWSLFAAVVLFQNAMLAAASLRAGHSWLSLLNFVPDLFVVAIMVSLIVVRRRWWHAIALLVFAVGPINWLSRSLG
jgi:hypothetical protein